MPREADIADVALSIADSDGRTLGLAQGQHPVNQGVLVGSNASIARMLDELAAVPGVRGAMLTFDEFVGGMENFGTHILPLMQCRKGWA